MVKNHLKRLAAPGIWKIKRKERTFITKQSPGPHNIKRSLPVSEILKTILKEVKTRREAKYVINNKSITIDKKPINTIKFSVGLMDVVDLPEKGESYRCLINTRGHIILIKINEKESEIKPLKVTKKSMIHGGKLQITTHDGRNFLDKKLKVNVGDTIVFDLKNKKVLETISFENGSLIFLTEGSHIGKLAKIKEIIIKNDLQKAKIMVEIEGKEYNTLKKYGFVIGKTKPVISLGIKNE